MSFRANRELLYEYIREVWQEGNPAAATKFISTEYKRHISPALPPLDPEGQVTRLTGFRAAFPDIEIIVEG
jgi:predicted SnoaL-like aldol condensation-catalyzing enzyme